MSFKLKSVEICGDACVDNGAEFGSVEGLCSCHENLARCLILSLVVAPNRRIAILS